MHLFINIQDLQGEKPCRSFFVIHIKKESENVMSTFDNFTVHPYKYLDICTWEETSKPKISFVDSFDYLDGKKTLPSAVEGRPCSFLPKLMGAEDVEEDLRIEPYYGYIDSICHVEIDAHIATTIRNLNQRGYKTIWCCEGHMNENSLKIGHRVDIAIGFSNNPQFATLPEGFQYVKYTCGFMVLENRVIPDNKYKCMTRTGNRCYYKGAEKLTDAEYQNCVDALFAAWDRLEKWSASLPMTAEKKAESERFQVLSRQKKTTLACCTYVTEVEFEVAEAGQPTRWLCYSDADFAGFVVTDRSSIADESKPQEYYEQVQVLENYEELEIARGSAYYALFAQMQKMAEEN